MLFIFLTKNPRSKANSRNTQTCKHDFFHYESTKQKRDFQTASFIPVNLYFTHKNYGKQTSQYVTDYTYTYIIKTKLKKKKKREKSRKCYMKRAGLEREPVVKHHLGLSE